MNNNKHVHIFDQRKPRIFTIGNPKELGFTKEDKDKVGYIEKVDDNNISWHSATSYTTSVIFAFKSDAFLNLNTEWFGESIYLYESSKVPVSVSFQLQGKYCIELDELISKFKEKFRAKNTKASEIALEKIFEFSPPINKYAIPPANTREREIWTWSVKMWISDWKKLTDSRETLKRHLRDIIKVCDIDI